MAIGTSSVKREIRILEAHIVQVLVYVNPCIYT